MTVDTSRTLATALCAVAAAVALVACDRPVRERNADATVATAQRKAAGEAVDTVANKVGDAAITTLVNAELARDSQLSALRVDVDTVDGRVTLRGDAPNTNARDRATALAQRVDGVKSVDNQLSIKADG
jgi:hyperosmotically inducible periplasmic protein